jgi:hypothetical protein
MKRFVMALGLMFAILGLVAFIPSNFDYHKREEVAKIGPVTATLDKPETARVPPAAGAFLIAGAVGIVLGPGIKQLTAPVSSLTADACVYRSRK